MLIEEHPFFHGRQNSVINSLHIRPLPRIYITKVITNKKVLTLNGNAWDRSVQLAEYIIEHNSTVRATAKIFGISKSTVHKDLTERLKKVNPQLYKQVRKVLDVNKQERHIRGGLATKHKYEAERELQHV